MCYNRLASLQDFTNISVEKLENYLLIISAMEDNYFEYMKIKDELSKVRLFSFTFKNLPLKRNRQAPSEFFQINDNHRMKTVELH